MKLLVNKNILITGGSRGIGKSIAELFAQQGGNVAFTYRSSQEKASALETELKANGIKVKAYQSDASSYAQSEELVNEVLSEFGSIDVLVNNAGITKDNLLLRMSEEQWDDVINTNLKSIYNMVKHVIRPMMRQRKGSIINMSSIIGIKGNSGQSNYAASKAGIIGFSKSIAQEMGSRNIRSNVIAPGYIQTDMTEGLNDDFKADFLKTIPLKRLGEPEDIANVCLFLASDLSAYITGQVLSVCGGLNQ